MIARNTSTYNRLVHGATSDDDFNDIPDQIKFNERLNFKSFESLIKKVELLNIITKCKFQS